MLLLLLLISVIKEPYPVERVDLLEVNHVYDERGCYLFDQLIIYDWNFCTDRYQVRTWRKITKKTPLMFPIRCEGEYVSRWYDGSGVSRYLRALSFRETWTRYDPEIEARDIVRVELRTPLKRFYRRRRN